MLCRLVPRVHALALKHSGNVLAVPYPMFRSLCGSSVTLWTICISSSTEALPLPAVFNSSLTQTVKCDPEAMANSFITLTLNQQYPELGQAVTKCHGDLHDTVL